MKSARRFMHPKRRVLVSDSEVDSVVFKEHTDFKRMFDDSEIKFLLRADEKKNLFNGSCVRMDSLSDGVCSLSEVGFFDFLTTNLVLKPASKSLNLHQSLFKFFSERYHREKDLEGRLKEAVKYYGMLSSFDSVLEVRELANIVAASVVLIDNKGRALLVKRGNKVVVSSGNFATSAAGSVSVDDVKESNPFVSCGIREIQEELGLQCELRITDVVISKQKLQPAVLLCGEIKGSFEELLDTMVNAEDFNAENESIYAVPLEKLNSVIKRYQFTDVAAYQLHSIAKDSWFFCGRVDIEKYRLF